MKNLYKIFILLIFYATCFFAQQDRVLAKIGDYRIYESEFNNRFDFSIHPNLLNRGDTLEIKKDFLNQLIAEKLLSLDAKEKGLQNNETFIDIMTPLQNMYVRDALYKSEIKDKVSYSNNEIKTGLERIKHVLKLKFLFSKNLDELNNIYTKLKKGASFDSLLSLRIESKDQIIPKEITFGTMDKAIEEEVYKLSITGYTKPIKSGDGFYILKLIEIVPNPDLKDAANNLEDVKRIVETRIEREKYLDYYHNFFAKNKITADKAIFENLVELFVPKFFEKYSLPEQKKDIDKIYLRGIEVNNIFYLMNEQLQNKEFIKLNNKSIKPKYFLNQLSMEGFYINDLSEKSIRASLSSYIRKFIEDELLTDEGKRKGLEKDREVKTNLGMWEDAYLSKMLMAKMMDSVKVTDDELKHIYEMNDWSDTIPDLVNVAEILTDKLEVIETVLQKLSEGADFKQLASIYSIRDSLKNKGGEYGFSDISSLGEIGEATLKMQIGDIYGPIKTDEGYSIIKLIDRKQDTTLSKKSFEDVKNEIEKKLTYSRLERLMNEYTVKLANKFGVQIDEGVLYSLSNNFLNLMVVRYMGFGGEIFAVPNTEQFSGWYRLWQQQKLVQ